MNQDVKVRLVKHVQYAESLGYDVIYASIYGAQNYGLDTEDSDVDSYLIIMPSLEDIALDREFKSVDLSYKENDVDTGEHIVIKDIRLFMKNIFNSDPHALEAFYSEYFICNKAVSHKTLERIKEVDCVRIAFPGFYFRLKKNLESFESKKVFDKLDWSLKKDRKSFLNLIVIYYTFIHMINGSENPFKIETPKLKEILLGIKKGEVSKDEAFRTFEPSHMLIDIENRWNYKIPSNWKGPDQEEKKLLRTFVKEAFESKFMEV